MIEAEYELLRHRQSESVPERLSPPQMEYLLSLSRSKRRGKMNWADTAYQLREQALRKMAHLETFDGKDSLLLPLVGSEVADFF